MGCATSKQVGATSPVTVYRPPPSSFAVFDINAIQEPWLKLDSSDENFETQEKTSLVPAPFLDKLDEEVGEEPRTWDEVSKVLEDLKSNQPVKPNPKATPNKSNQPAKSSSFHTVEEVDAPAPKPALNRLKKSESLPDLSSRVGEVRGLGTANPGEFRSVKVNPFILKDRMEMEKEGKEAAFDKIMKAKRDPLGDYPEICPPGGAQLVVLYTTSLGGVRRTFEDCNRVRAILENHRVVFDERDVSLHAGFRTELRELVGPGEGVPRLFVKGRYLGGVDEVVDMNELGRLGRVMSSARVDRGAGWQACEGCGGARFIPCLKCGGSCKVVVKDTKERCPHCNENGLVHCPRCH